MLVLAPAVVPHPLHSVTPLVLPLVLLVLMMLLLLHVKCANSSVRVYLATRLLLLLSLMVMLLLRCLLCLLAGYGC